MFLPRGGRHMQALVVYEPIPGEDELVTAARELKKAIKERHHIWYWSFLGDTDGPAGAEVKPVIIYRIEGEEQ